MYVNQGLFLQVEEEITIFLDNFREYTRKKADLQVPQVKQEVKIQEYIPS